jgi:glycosyltransferase involved in cell wall biosynthesis
MRVGLFTECYHPIQNGVVASVDALRETLTENGHDVVCIAPFAPAYRDTSSGIVRLASLPLPTPTQYRLTLPMLSGDARVALENVAIVHAHSPFVTGRLALRAARSHGVPLIFTYHTRLEYYAHYAPFDARATRAIADGWTRAIANAADAVIAPTHSAASALRAIGVRARIEVIPSGIDVAHFASGTRREALRRAYGAGAGDVLAIWVGRLGREKNVELALATIAQLPAAYRLAFVGDGPDREALESAAGRLGRAIHFAGELRRDALADVYASADVLLFTSSSETQGLVLAEALAAGLPIAAVDAPSNREVLAGSGEFAAADGPALAAAVRRAVAGGRGREAALRRALSFERGAVGTMMLELYRSVLRR